MVACAVIAWNGARLFRGGLRALLDANAPAAVHEQIRRITLGVDGVGGIEDLRARRSGLVYLVDIHVWSDRPWITDIHVTI